MMKKWIAAATAAALAACAMAAAASEAPSPPKLILLISIDQFSADLFNASRSEFRGGLATLAQGIVYSNGFHAQGVTETCAGHAVIASGRHPAATGIIANQWYDQRAGIDRYCTDDGVHVAARAKNRKLGTGPAMLEVSTLGDWLKAASPANRVYSVAGKDRSAIMMGGHHPDGAFWFDGKQGFDTWGSDAEDAERRLAPLAVLNARLAPRLATPPVWTYRRESCRIREAVISLPGGQSFHAHLPPDPSAAIPGQPPASGAALPPWFYDRLTVDAAIDLIEGQKLGRSSGTDLLAVGLSATDMVGHAYGTQGPEMCDQMARVDEEVGRLLKRIGEIKIPVLVALSADHGGGDIPERLATRGYRDAGRIDATALLTDLNTAARAATGVDWNPLRPAFFDPTQLVVVDAGGRSLADTALKNRIAEATAARALTRPGIAGAWTAAQLQAYKPDPRRSPDLMPVADRMALSFYPARSGDILLATDPLKIAAPPLPGLFMMGHSGPSDFNRRVPILFWWPGAAHQERALPVRVADLAPTLAAAVRIAPADPVDGECLELHDGGTACPAAPVAK